MTKKLLVHGTLLTGALMGLAFSQAANLQTVHAAETSVAASSTKPLTFKGTFRYTNGLPVKAGTPVNLRNLKDGTTVLTKKTDANGQVVFTEADGLKKGVNYSVETAGYRYGYTFRSDIGQDWVRSFEVQMPQAAKPLTFTGTFRYANGLPVKAGTKVTLRNLKDGKTKITKETDAKGQVTFTEADGLKKEVNWSVETAGMEHGYTFRSDLGKNWEKNFTLLAAGNNTGTAVKAAAKAPTLKRVSKHQKHTKHTKHAKHSKRNKHKSRKRIVKHHRSHKTRKHASKKAKLLKQLRHLLKQLRAAHIRFKI